MAYLPQLVKFAMHFEIHRAALTLTYSRTIRIRYGDTARIVRYRPTSGVKSLGRWSRTFRSATQTQGGIRGHD